MTSQKIRWMRLRIVRRMTRLSKQVRHLPFWSIVISVVVTISKSATIFKALLSLTGSA
jgi:hypothetical protein